MRRTATPKDGTYLPSRKKSILLLRVSTKDQLTTAADIDPEGLSIGTQRAVSEDKSEKLNADVVRVFIEPGYSAGKLTIDERPVFQELLTFLKTNPDIDYVIVYMRSRIFRNRYEAAIVDYQLKKMGIRLISAKEDFGEGPYAEAIEGMVDVMNHFTNKVQGLDIQEKLRRKAVDLGGTISRARLGYLNVRVDHEGTLVNSIAVDAKRAPLVRKAFELYATGKYPIERLEATMADLGLTTRPTKRYPEQPVSGSKLHDMLGDPYYVGFVVYKGDIYPGRHEPIITPELFERVQEVMKARSGRGQRDRVHHHYLKGFLFCDRCHQSGRTSRLIFAEVTGRGGAKYQYFVCRGREDGLCNLPHLRVELVEQAIIEHYETLALPRDFVSELRSLLDETLADETTNVRERHAALQRQLKKLDQQEDRLVMALADDTMPTGKIKAKLQEITIQRARIEAGLTNTAAELSLGVEMLRDALRLVANPRQLYHDGTDSIRRLLNETFFERFYLDDPDVATDEKTSLFTELHDAHRAYRHRATAEGEGIRLTADRGGHHPASGSNGGRRRKHPSTSYSTAEQQVNGGIAPGNESGLTLASVFSVTGSGKAVLVGLTGFEPATT
ncbi:recombinase family protein [Nocardia wallacei]|uniref:recombinase family protein n=1 Tax=Nocardia wallacei TaxID=480035 RepID=UPI0024572331|nr:recombinase family protein [Nocardia wallacei]